MVKLYIKPSCKVCQKATKYLKKKKIDFEELDILVSPPAKKLLEKAVDANDPKSAFNTKSKGYKEHGIAEATFNTKKDRVLRGRFFLHYLDVIRAPHLEDTYAVRASAAAR